MSTRTVSGILRDLNGNPIPSAHVTLELLNASYTLEAIYEPSLKAYQTDANGLLTANLWANEEGDQASLYRAVFPGGDEWTFTLPAGTIALTWSEVRALGISTQEPQAQTAMTYVDGQIAAHGVATDPHTVYQLEGAKGQPAGYASLGLDGLVPASQLPPATAAPARGNVVLTTPSLAAGAQHSVTVALGATFDLISLTVSHAARVRLYSTDAARTADAGRAITADPADTVAPYLIAEVVLPLGAELSIPVGVLGSSLANPLTNDVFALIDNTGTVAQTITVTFARLVLEAV
jgi:hypothetical protein